MEVVGDGLATVAVVVAAMVVVVLEVIVALVVVIVVVMMVLVEVAVVMGVEMVMVTVDQAPSCINKASFIIHPFSNDSGGDGTDDGDYDGGGKW